MEYRTEGLVGMRGPEGASLSFELDAAGRRRTSEYANGERFGFERDALGRVTAATDGLGNRWIAAYDASGNLSRLARPGGGEFHFTYSPLGALKTISDARGNVRQLVHDTLGRRIAQTDPLGRTTSWTYGPGGAVASIQAPDGESTITRYDLLGRVVKIEYPNGSTAAFSYDVVGNLREESLGRYSATYEYDDGDRPVKVHFEPAGTTLLYRYDDSGRRNALEIAGVGNWKYEYDASDRLTGVSTPENNTIQLEYDEASRLRSEVLSCGAKIEQEFDARNRLLALRVQGNNGTELLGRNYRHDAAGNLIHEHRQDGSEFQYGYDGDQRLIRRDGAEGSIELAYDKVGNLSRTGVPAEFDAADQLVRFGEERFEYSVHGSLVRRHGPQGMIEYEYGPRQRLVGVRRDGKLLAQFGYDPSGRRVWKQTGSEITHYVYDGDRLVAELDGQGTGAANLDPGYWARTAPLFPQRRENVLPGSRHDRLGCRGFGRRGRDNI